MKPVMRDDAYWAEVDDGAYFLTNMGPVRLTGRSVGPWIDRLAPWLDGRHTLADLTAGLPPERGALIERLIQLLHERGVVRDGEADEPQAGEAPQAGPHAPGGRSPGGDDTHAAEIRYIGCFRGAAATRFDSYRARSTVVVGSGPVALGLARAGRSSGLADVRVVPPGSWASDPGQTAALLEGLGLVVHVVDDEQTANQAAILEQCCAAAGVPLAQVVLGTADAWVFAILPGDTGTGWSAARSRLSPPESPGSAGDVGHTAMTAVAAQVVQRACRRLTGVSPLREGHRVTRIGFDPLHSEEHRFIPHPYALAAPMSGAESLRRRLAALAHGPQLSEPEFSRRAAHCVDDRLGIFHFVDRDWAQVPLRVAGAELVSGVPATRSRVVGAAFDFQTARCRAALAALASYSARMVDPRLLVDPATGEPLTVAGDPTRAVAAIRAGALPAAVWSCVLGGGAPDRPTDIQLLPAAAAFPVLLGPPRDSHPAPVGVAAGYDWHEAVMGGLLAHCRDLTLDEALLSSTPYPRVDLAAVALGDTGRRCRDLLGYLAELPDVYHLTGSTGVPTFAFCRGTATTTVSAGVTAESALASGLLQVLLGVQSRVHGQPQYAPPPSREFPLHLRGDQMDELREDPPLDPVAVVARLRTTGREAVVVPLDHDPGIAEVIPYVVNVVVRDAGRTRDA